MAVLCEQPAIRRKANIATTAFARSRLPCSLLTAHSVVAGAGFVGGWRWLQRASCGHKKGCLLYGGALLADTYDLNLRVGTCKRQRRRTFCQQLAQSDATNELAKRWDDNVSRPSAAG